jgi:hypothetical protein
VAGQADLIGEEPVAELRVVAVRVETAFATWASSSSASVTGAASHRQ